MKIDRKNWVCPKCHKHIESVLPVVNYQGVRITTVLVNGDDITCLCPECHEEVWRGRFSSDSIRGINEALTSRNVSGTPARMQE